MGKITANKITLTGVVSVHDFIINKCPEYYVSIDDLLSIGVKFDTPVSILSSNDNITVFFGSRKNIIYPVSKAFRRDVHARIKEKMDKLVNNEKLYLKVRSVFYEENFKQWFAFLKINTIVTQQNKKIEEPITPPSLFSF